MNKRILSTIIAGLFFFGCAGCAVITSGEGTWEVYAGVRTKAVWEKDAKVEIQSKVVESWVNESD